MEKASLEVSISNRSEDPDGIHPECLKHKAPKMKTDVLFRCSKDMEEKTWPIEYNETFFKLRKTKFFNNTQAVTVRSKIVMREKIDWWGQKKELLKNINEKDLKHRRQEGFCNHKSTSWYNTELTVDITNAWKAGRNPIGLMVEVEKTIESVCTNGIHFKLNQHNVNGSLCKVFENLLCKPKIQNPFSGFHELWFQHTGLFAQSSALHQYWSAFS